MTKIYMPAALAEVAWLSAVLLVPISCDLLSGQIFTGIKTGLIQTLGIASLLGLSWHLLIRSEPRAVQPALAFPIAAAISLLGISWASSAMALDPSRAGDSASVLSLAPLQLAPLLALFLAAAIFLRTTAQLERLALAALASGFAVAFLALLQRYGFHAVEYPGINGTIITSFVGGPIFLAGYLLMLIPLGVWRLRSAFREAGGRFDLSVAAACFLLTVLVGGFLVCEKRGPVIGLLSAGLSAMVLLSAARRRYRLLLAAGALFVFSALLLLALSIMRIQGAPLEKIPILERLSMILPIGGERSHDYRTMLWGLLPEIAFAPTPVVMPCGENDPHHALRPWLGFGPDNVQAVLPSRYIFLQAWPSDALEASCHNHVWDVTLSLGVCGVLAFFAVFFAVWRRGLLALHLDPPSTWRSFITTMVVAISGGFICSTLFGLGFFALGAQAGFLAALLALALASRVRTCDANGKDPDGPEFLVVALLAALAGHWADLGFIFPTAENGALFWIFGGAVVGYSKSAASHKRPNALQPAASTWWSTVAGCAVVSAIIHARADVGAVLRGEAGLAGLFGDASQATTTAALAIISLGICCAIWHRRSKLRALAERQKASAFKIALAVGGVYLAIVMWLVRAMLSNPPSPGNPWLTDIWAVHFLIASAAANFLVAALWAAGIPRCTKLQGAALFCLSALALSAIWLGPIADARSAVSAGLGRKLTRTSPEWLERSIEIKPNVVRNYAYLGDYLAAEAAAGSQTEAERRNILQAAEKYLQAGVDISPFTLLSAKLGRVQIKRALSAQDAQERSFLARRARMNFAHAVRFAPQNEPAWVDAAFVEKEFFGEDLDSVRMLETADSVTLTPADYQNVVEKAWGLHYVRLALIEENPRLRLHYAQRAKRYLEVNLQLTMRAANTGEGLDQIHLQELDEAISYLSVARRMTGDEAIVGALEPAGATRSEKRQTSSPHASPGGASQ